MKLNVIGTRGFPGIEGGVEKHCESLYPLIRKDISVNIYRRRSYVKTRDSYSNILFIDLPSTRIRGIETVIHSFLASVLTLLQKPDVVHYHNIGPALFSPIVKLRKIPVVLTYHSPNYEHKKWGDFAKKILLFSEKVALKTADKIVFVNSFQMEKYNEDIRIKSVFVPNGIGNTIQTDKVDYLTSLKLEKNKYILSVGRITPEKGFDTLIRAYREAKLQSYKLVIAGGVEFENKYQKELESLANDEDVIFTGYVFGENLAQLYMNAAIYVLASNNEGFPLVLLEAMSYGLDVLVSDIPATHLVDLESDDYFETGNYQELSAKLIKRVSSNKKREYNLEKYNWHEIAETMSNIYYEVVEKR